jgi:hypothetical protein
MWEFGVQEQVVLPMRARFGLTELKRGAMSQMRKDFLILTKTSDHSGTISF